MRFKRIVLNSLFFIFLFSNSAYAESITSEGNLFLGIFKFIVYILLFVAVIFISIYGTRYIAKNFNNVANSKYINNIDAISLSTNLNVFLMEFQGKYYLLAANENHIEVLDTFKKEDISLGLEDIAEVNRASNNIMNLFKDRIHKEDDYE